MLFLESVPKYGRLGLSALQSNLGLFQSCSLSHGEQGFGVSWRRQVAKLCWNGGAWQSRYLSSSAKPSPLRGWQEVLDNLDREVVQTDPATQARLLESCKNARGLPDVRRIEADVVRSGLQRDIFLYNNLVSMYGRYGSLEDSRRVFEKMVARNVVTWNAMIAIYGQHGQGKEALQIFRRMLREGVITANKITFAAALNACPSAAALAEGKLIHAGIIDRGIELDVIVGNALINMYGKCGSLVDAIRIYDRMEERDTISWTGMIAAYAVHGYGKRALQMFRQMQQKGLIPNRATFNTILSVCEGPEDVADARLIHAVIIERGFDSDAAIQTGIVNMYAKCGSPIDAYRIFDKLKDRSVASWNALITSYIRIGQGKKALEPFCQMQLEGVMPNEITFTTILSACDSPAALAEGRLIHGCVVQRGFDSDIAVGAAIINMYGKCGSLEDARTFFNSVKLRNEVLWDAAIAAYAQNNHGKEALELFHQMQLEGVIPSNTTFVTALNVCASMGTLAEGKLIHNYVDKLGLELEVGPAIVNMYGKCGSLEDARRLFDKMPEQNVALWNAMIAIYSLHGCAVEALQLFEMMQMKGVAPNAITFAGILSACSLSGLVDEGHQYFDYMIKDFGITPTAEHYACIIDLLGRAGKLDEAEDFANKMPVKPGTVAWMALFGAYRVHGDVERGKHTAEHILRVDPLDAAAYIVLSNVYSAADRLDEAANVKQLMADRGVKSGLGHSSIEVNDKLHEFVVGDRLHPQMDEIYAGLERLKLQMEEAGYALNTKLLLHDVEEEQQEQSVSHHSEKLAIVFGLINVPSGTPLFVIKNVRVCEDCHTAIKFISKIVDREIFLRDPIRFHHFEDGACSCGDYW